jgi:hypothetical protein
VSSPLSKADAYSPASTNTYTSRKDVVAFRADSLAGPWSQPFFVSPAYTRTFSTQSGFSWTVNGTKQTTHLYMGDQWDSNSLWESRNVWLPLEVDEEKGSIEVLWHDIFDLDVYVPASLIPR